KLDRFVQGNRDALAIVRVPSEEEAYVFCLRPFPRQGSRSIGLKGCSWRQQTRVGSVSGPFLSDCRPPKALGSRGALIAHVGGGVMIEHNRAKSIGLTAVKAALSSAAKSIS